MLTQTQDNEEIIARVAALDIGKAELVCCVRVPADTATGAVKTAIIARRGKEARSIAKVAAARRLLILVYYGMRDGQIRCLSSPPKGPPPANQVARVA